ncbi:MAG: YceI family protein [Chloroflexota bacterium]
MKRQQLFIGLGLIAVVLLGTFYYAFFRTPEGASGDISEVMVEVEANAAEGATVFTIDPTQTVASFTIAEVLRGEDYVVVGTTDQVGGQVVFDPNNLASAQIGEIVINARTFITDSDMRNNAINNRILFTDEFEFVRFQPTAINGLPEGIQVGDSVDVEIMGDLTIMDVTKSTSFSATLTYGSTDQLSGIATTTILYGDYGVEVPLTPSVSFVSDELTMDLDFVATASQ